MVWEQFKKTVDAHALIKPGDSVLASVSGGGDSVCLLHLLVRLKKEKRFSLAVVYFNHGLRMEHILRREAAFVKNLAVKHDLRFHLISFAAYGLKNRKDLSIEEYARKLRYAFYRDLSKKFKYTAIALGHHADDQAETVLFRLIRGTGVTGIAGIPIKRRLEGSNAFLVRPLLKVTKNEINHFLKQEHIAFKTDATNAENKFARNRIRNKLIPYLRQFNPRITEHVVNLAESAGEDKEFWDITAKTIAKSMLSGTKNNFTLDLLKFNKYHKTIRKKVILSIFTHINNNNINGIITLGESGRTGKKIVVAGNWQIERSYNKLVCSCTGQDAVSSGNNRYYLEVPGITNVSDSFRVATSLTGKKSTCYRSSTGKAYVDWDAVAGRECIIRYRRPGDMFYPYGMKGSMKLQDFFINAAVPRSARDRVPLFCAGEDICWVVGYRTDDRFKVHQKTKTILEITIEK